MTILEVTKEIQDLAKETGVDFIKAASAMQGAAAKKGSEELITVIHNLKMEYLNLK
tara:strand:- start:403 stop:570 length:168 start_codon:yes stop_codon:yes gene_type:complete